VNYQDGMQKLAADRRQIRELRERMRAVRSEIEPQKAENYRFATVDGEVSLADLFGPKRDLFVVHNMGRSCAYCTMWADGFNGVYPHLANRAAFVVAFAFVAGGFAEGADATPDSWICRLIAEPTRPGPDEARSGPSTTTRAIASWPCRLSESSPHSPAAPTPPSSARTIAMAPIIRVRML